MTTNVRAKMTCFMGIADQPYMRFGAVYEGSKELQGISENAIFGDATPSGSLQLDPADYSNRFTNGEDYYIDLSLIEPREGVLLKRKMRLSYVTPEADRCPDCMVQFRYISTEVYNAHLEMCIRNPVAIEALVSHAELWLSIQVASGRRSDAEIALREKALAEHLTDPYHYRDTHPDSFATQTARLERALRRSQGLDY
jgi:hypothetical protein